jgi:two-component system, sensor histidine kinase and response regulator
VVLAYNGEEALQQVQWQRPDLILLDVMMPGMNGFEVCKRLKDNPDTCLIPVVIMTALGQTEDRIRVLMRAPTISSPSRSTATNYWRVFAPRCA